MPRQVRARLAPQHGVRWKKHAAALPPKFPVCFPVRVNRGLKPCSLHLAAAAKPQRQADTVAERCRIFAQQYDHQASTAHILPDEVHVTFLPGRHVLRAIRISSECGTQPEGWRATDRASMAHQWHLDQVLPCVPIFTKTCSR